MFENSVLFLKVIEAWKTTSDTRWKSDRQGRKSFKIGDGIRFEGKYKQK